MKYFLLKELNKLNVIDKNKLIDYVDFCLNNSLDKPIKFETSYHHILPKAKSLPWFKYKNLKEYPWNGVHLFHRDHFIAHSILSEAVSEISILIGWNRMKNTGNYNEILSPESYQILCERGRIAAGNLHRGMKRTEETKKNISKSLKGRKLSKDHIEKNSINASLQMTEYHRNYLSIRNSGRKHTKEEIEKQIAAQTGKKQKIATCPHCNKTGGNALMSRWHFDKCNKNPNISQENINLKKATCPHCNKTGGINTMKRWHFNNCKERL